MRNRGTERPRLGIVLVFATLTACLPPQFGEPSVEVEEFDADRGLREMRHELGYDFAWVNPRMQHVVHVVVPGRGRHPRVQCNGVLVGPDLVFTAAHCLKSTAYVSDQCRITLRPGSRRGYVVFDDQVIQDASLSGTLRRGSRPVDIAQIAAIPPGRLVYTADLVAGVCRSNPAQRQYDGVLLRLAESLPERGRARVRIAVPGEGQLSPVLHHISASSPKQVSAVRILPPDPTYVDAHLGTQLNLLGRSGFDFPPIQCGSSGSPLFDEEGYVLGLVSGADLPPGALCTVPGGAPVFFSSTRSL